MSRIVHEDENVTVTASPYNAGGLVMEDGVFKVQFAKGLGLRSKTFKGETAWSDSQRYAEDMLLSEGIRTFLYW